MERTAHFYRLGKLFDGWMKLSDAELLTEAQKVFPGEGSRDKCLKVLVMTHVEFML